MIRLGVVKNKIKAGFVFDLVLIKVHSWFSLVLNEWFLCRRIALLMNIFISGLLDG